jgi:formylglycine-generating enzyme required for sulfatase activity
MAIAAALWWWIEGPAAGPSPGPPLGSAAARGPESSMVQSPLAVEASSSSLAQELHAVESRLRAETARRRWEATAAQCPAVLCEDLRVEAANLAAAASIAAALLEQGRHEQAQSAFEHAADGLCRLLDDDRDARLAADSAWEVWAAAMRAAPPAWVDDVARETAAAAQALADEAGEACQAGRFRSAAPLYQQAAARMGEASLREPATAPDLAPGPEEAASPDERNASLAEAAPVAGVAPPAPPVAPSGASAVLVNSLSQTLVFVVPGAFRMGCDPGEDGADICGPQHSVQLSHGFYMGRVEVTRGQFAAFVGAAGYLTTAERAGWALGLDESGRWQRVAGLSWRNPGFTQTDSHPVVCVSADDAEAFCLWIGGREGRRYRLPTEAEWEYACRAGGLTAWSWGDSPTAGEPRCNGADDSWAQRFPGYDAFDWNDGHGFTSPVAAFTANDWGLFDMHGNAQEWCQDIYAPYSGEDAVDPVGAALESSGASRVLRGGSFASLPNGCRAAQRDAAPADASLVTTGFRVVMDPQ